MKEIERGGARVEADVIEAQRWAEGSLQNPRAMSPVPLNPLIDLRV